LLKNWTKFIKKIVHFAPKMGKNWTDESTIINKLQRFFSSVQFIMYANGIKGGAKNVSHVKTCSSGPNLGRLELPEWGEPSLLGSSITLNNLLGLM